MGTQVRLSVPPKSWIDGIRQTNPVPRVGVQSLKIDSSSGVSENDVTQFLEWLGELIETDGGFDRPVTQEHLEQVNGTRVTWTRARYQLYPIYLELLEVVESLNESPATDLPGLIAVKPNVWRVEKGVFETGCQNYRRNSSAWSAFVKQVVESGAAIGGFAFNMLEVPSDELRNGEIDVHPLVLHALDEEGRACDRGRPFSQAAIANAFWQTFWATGALRTQRGHTFPVAFLPIDRSWSGEYVSPWDSRWVSLHRKIYGRTSLMAYMCEALTGVRALWFDRENLSFVVDRCFDPKPSGLAWGDYQLCLFELNRTAFVDAYSGDNANIFSCWREAEEGGKLPRAPWPQDVAGLTACSSQPEYIQDVAADHTGRFVRIHRIVPFAGCAFLSEVVNETEELKRCGKIRSFEDTIIGATNSTFFLNFPEEYVTLHSAMNDPFAALVESGFSHQIRTLRRAAFVLTEEGQAHITTDVGLKLNCPALCFEGESVAATYYRNSDKPFSENRIGPLNFGVVVVGNSIVETFEDQAAEVPANGWVLGDSEAFTDEFDPRLAASVEFRCPETGMPLNLRHVFAVGPLLLRESEIVPLGSSKEEFQPIRIAKPPKFEEGAELPRTGIAPALSEAPSRGVPPTRFPYDWNQTRAPRTAIGIREDGSVVLVVVDGRAKLPHSVGATLAELAQLMKNLGCRDAMNMDGGGSSVMFVNDLEVRPLKLSEDLRPGVVNLPSDLGGVERLLPVPLVVARRQSRKS